MSRRRVLITGGSAGALFLVDGSALGRAAQAAGRIMAFTGPPTRTIRLVRGADQVDVLVELFDTVLTGGVVTPAGAEPAIRLTFGSQHTAERMFEIAAPITVGANPAVAAGPSRVVVPVASPFPLSLDSLIAQAEAALSVQEFSGPVDQSATSLELPAGLALSPGPLATLTAARDPFTVDDVTEVWTAQFRGANGAPTRLRAVANLSPTDLVDRIPDTVDRGRLVSNTSLDLLEADRLWLSSAGAFAHLRGDWPTQTLTRYRHRITTGRDVHVQVVTAGFLVPFGHPASVVEIADRVTETDAAGVLTSVVRLRRFLTISRPVVVPAGRIGQDHEGRANPFVRLLASTDETQPIDQVPVTPLAGPGTILGAFDIVKAGTATDLLVDYVATDRDGNQVSFSLPATFIEKEHAFGLGPLSPVNRLIAKWNAAAGNRNEVDLDGQKVAFADPVAPGVGQTSKPTHEFRFSMARSISTEAELEAAGVPGFNPEMTHAYVTDEFLEAASGTKGAAKQVVHHPRWLDHGNNSSGSANFDLAFLRLSTPETGRIGGDLPVQGVAQIDLRAEIFSQSATIGLDLPSVDIPWDPAVALGAASKILGSINLADLIEPVNFADAVPGLDIPNTDIEVTTSAVTITYSFKPKLRSSPLVGFVARPDTRCCVIVTATAPLTGDAPAEASTEMTISDFTMVFPPGGVAEIIEIDYDKLTARVASDGSLVVDPKMGGWRLGDDLGFLQPLFDTLERLGGLTVDISSEALSLDAGVTLPNLSLGLLRISNFKISFGLDLPLNGQPVQLGAGVGSKANPVDVKLGIFGGGFYVGLDLAFHTSQVDWTVRAGATLFMEIGADLVIIKASLRLEAVFSFVFVKADGDSVPKFSGSVSLEGVIGIKGLIEVSAALTGTLTYNAATQIGRAKGTIRWNVDTALGSKDGEIKLGAIDFELGDGTAAAGAGAGAAGVAARSGVGAAALAAAPGAGPDAAPGVDPAVGPAADPAGTRPSFGDLYTRAAWTTYAGAFA